MFDIVVLASGRGSNFAALAAAQRGGELPIRLRALLSDKRTAPALLLAENAGVATIAIAPRDFADRASFDRALEIDPRHADALNNRNQLLMRNKQYAKARADVDALLLSNGMA